MENLAKKDKSYAFSKIDKQILNLIVKCVACLGGQSDILGDIASWKDCQTDEETKSNLESWLEGEYSQSMDL